MERIEWSQTAEEIEVRVFCPHISREKLFVEFYSCFVKIVIRDRLQPHFVDTLFSLDWHHKNNGWELRDDWLIIRAFKSVQGLWPRLKADLSRDELRRRRKEAEAAAIEKQQTIEKKRENQATELLRKVEKEQMMIRSREKIALDEVKNSEKEKAIDSVYLQAATDTSSSTIFAPQELEIIKAKGLITATPIRSFNNSHQLNFTPRMVENVAARERHIFEPPKSRGEPLSAFWLRDRGDQLFANKDFTGAETAYLNHLEKSPSDVKALNNLSVSQLRQGNLHECLKSCDRGLSSSPSPSLHLLFVQRKCFCLVANGQLELAKQTLQAIEETHADLERLKVRLSLEPLLEKARALLQEKRFCEANKVLQSATELCPLAWQVHSNFAFSLSQQGQWADSFEELVTLGKLLSPLLQLFAPGKLPPALLSLEKKRLRRVVECFYGLGKEADAAEFAAELVKLDPADEKGQEILKESKRRLDRQKFIFGQTCGLQRIRMGEFVEGLKLLTEAEQLADDRRYSADLLLLLCNKTAALMQLKDYHSVLRESNKALRLFENFSAELFDEQRRRQTNELRVQEAHERLRLRRVHALSFLGMPRAAREEIDRLLSFFPQSIEAAAMLREIEPSDNKAIDQQENSVLVGPS